jgi:hypothetical protein
LDEKTVLDHRLTTLNGLLDAPGGPLGSNAGDLGARLRADWLAEQRLLSRLLAETSGDDVRATIQSWRRRTEAFVARSSDPSPHWTDKEGITWNARQVLTLLDDAQERIDRWMGQPDHTEATITTNVSPETQVAPDASGGVLEGPASHGAASAPDDGAPSG